MTTLLVDEPLNVLFWNDMVTDQLPGDSDETGMSKPWHVELLGPAWTLAVAVYVPPSGPLAVRAQVPSEVTV